MAEEPNLAPDGEQPPEPQHVEVVDRSSDVNAKNSVHENGSTFLHLHLMQAKDLPRTNSAISSLWLGKCNPYCTIKYESRTFKSKTISSSLKPEWDEKCDFQLNDSIDGSLNIQLWSSNKSKSFDDLVGTCEVALADISEAKEKRIEENFKLLNEVNQGEITLGFLINSEILDLDDEVDSSSSTHVIDGNHMLVEYRHENQRLVDDKWTKPDTVKGDPPSWSSPYNEHYIEERLWMKIPSRWHWCTDWEIDRTEEDKEGEGWMYGLKWNDVKSGGSVSDAEVRTRLWKRARRFTSQDHAVTDPDPDMHLPDLTNFGMLGVRDAVDVLGTFRNKFFVLEGQTLYWFTDDPAKNPNAKCEDLLMTSQITEIRNLSGDDASGSTHILIATGESRYTIKCVNEDQQNQWFSDIQKIRQKWRGEKPNDNDDMESKEEIEVISLKDSKDKTSEGNGSSTKDKDEEVTEKSKKKKKSTIQDLPFKEGLKKKGYKLDVQQENNKLWLGAEISDVMVQKGSEIHRLKIHFIGFHKAYDKWMPSTSEALALHETNSSEKTRQQAIDQKMLPERGARQITGKDKKRSSVDEYQQCRCIIS